MTELRQAAQMALEQQQAELTCPECKAAVLYECVACSSNNYPPQRPWVGLTDEEIKTALVIVDPETKRLPPGLRDFARVVEAKLKGKNSD